MRVPATNDAIPLQLGPKVPSTEVTPEREQVVAKRFGEVLFESVDLGRIVGITEADCQQFKVDEACPLRDGAVAAAPECGSLPPAQITGFEPSALLGSFSEAAEKSKSAQPSDDGWIEWKAGDGMPALPPQTQIAVQVGKDRRLSFARPAALATWNFGADSSIRAYRIVG